MTKLALWQLLVFSVYIYQCIWSTQHLIQNSKIFHERLIKKNSMIFFFILKHLMYPVLSMKFQCSLKAISPSDIVDDFCKLCDDLFKIITNCLDGLVQDRRDSTANALELHLSCTKPSVWPSPNFLWITELKCRMIFFKMSDDLLQIVRHILSDDPEKLFVNTEMQWFFQDLRANLNFNDFS